MDCSRRHPWERERVDDPGNAGGREEMNPDRFSVDRSEGLIKALTREISGVPNPSELRAEFSSRRGRSARPVLKSGGNWIRIRTPITIPVVLLAIAWCFVLAGPSSLRAEEDSGLLPNRADEPFAKTFSLNKAVRFLDRTAVAWNQEYECITCHTSGLYLTAGAPFSKDTSSYRESRRFAQSYLRQWITPKPPEGDPGRDQKNIHGVVATTAFLALGDAETRDHLDPITEQGFDFILSRLSEDGSWNEWLKCGWPPYEQDDHFGVTLAAIALGAAPGGYKDSPAGRRGLDRLAAYLESHPPSHWHHRGMMLWAARHLPDLLESRVRESWRDGLIGLQRDDGGWALDRLAEGKWLRDDGTPQNRGSDAYATAFAVFVLRQSGVDRDAPPIRRGLDWLRRHQRESGRWFCRSPKKDRRHYISHAATAFAVMAFKACDLPMDEAGQPSR